MATGTIRVREGTSDDLAEVREFTQDTFSWGDYVPGAWEGWVHSRRGELMVAEIDGKVVGTVHLRFLEHGEAWLEGLRVRHTFRQRGVASILVQAVNERARGTKCAIIRLETGARNLAAQRTFEKHGFKREARYAEYRAPAQIAALDSVRLANLEDAPDCLDTWQNSWLKRAARSVVPAAYGWRWWEFTAERLADDIRAGHVWMTKGGFIVLRPEDNGLDVRLAVGTKRAAVRLLGAARALAHQDQKGMVYWLLPHCVRSGEWARAAGFSLDQDDLLIYALAL